MTDTVEGIMALADKLIDKARTHGAVMFSRSQDGWPAEETTARAALRAAVERVIAERDFKAALVHELLPYQDRAEKAEARLAAAEARNKEHEMFRRQHRDCDAMGVRLQAAEALLEDCRDHPGDQYVLERIDAFLKEKN